MPRASTLCGDDIDSEGAPLGATGFRQIARSFSSNRSPCDSRLTFSNDPACPSAALAHGSRLLGLARARVERMAARPDPRSAGDRDRVASPRRSMVLDGDEPSPHRPPAGLSRDPGADSHDGRREPHVGRPTDPRRIAEAWNRDESGVRGEEPGPLSTATIADVARVPDQSEGPTDGGGLLRGPHLSHRLLFVLVLLAHDRRRIVHVAVTTHPTAAWTAQQVREACPWDAAHRYLNLYCEYYGRSRTHLSLDKDSPIPRPIAPAHAGRAVGVWDSNRDAASVSKWAATFGGWS
jgi:hypothetical protein